MNDYDDDDLIINVNGASLKNRIQPIWSELTHMVRTYCQNNFKKVVSNSIIP
jgi:hypothetical protein